MKKNILSISALALLATTSLAFAQADVAGHPRVNEVNQRLENQQERIDNGVKDGQINAKQEMRDEKRDAKIATQESKDEAKHGGHLTKKEQTHLNKALDKNSEKIHDQRTDGK